MRFFAAVASALLAATSVAAQSVTITSPANGATVTAGAPLTVRVSRQAFQSSSVEVAVGIALRSCGTGTCGGTFIGDLLYNGPFNPTQHEPNSATYYQDITVNVPANLEAGSGLLNVVHFAYIGASLTPWVQDTLMETITIV